MASTIELEAKLQWIADYNQKKKEKPDFSEAEMIEIRAYQMEKSKNRMEELSKIDWSKENGHKK